MPKCISILSMPNLKERQICIKFCVNLGKSGAETCDMIQKAFRSYAMRWSKIFDWHISDFAKDLFPSTMITILVTYNLPPQLPPRKKQEVLELPIILVGEFSLSFNSNPGTFWSAHVFKKYSVVWVDHLK